MAPERVTGNGAYRRIKMDMLNEIVVIKFRSNRLLSLTEDWNNRSDITIKGTLSAIITVALADINFEK